MSEDHLSDHTGIVIILALAAAIPVACFFLWKKHAWLSRMRNRFMQVLPWYGPPDDDWALPSLIYRVPFSIFRFFVMVWLVLWLSIFPAAYGLNSLIYLETLAMAPLGILLGLDSIPGIIGIAGVIITLVIGIYQDTPASRLKTLAVIGAFGLMIGFGERFTR